MCNWCATFLEEFYALIWNVGLMPAPITSDISLSCFFVSYGVWIPSMDQTKRMAFKLLDLLFKLWFAVQEGCIVKRRTTKFGMSKVRNFSSIFPFLAVVRLVALKLNGSPGTFRLFFFRNIFIIDLSKPVKKFHFLSQKCQKTSVIGTVNFFNVSFRGTYTVNLFYYL